MDKEVEIIRNTNLTMIDDVDTLVPFLVPTTFERLRSGNFGGANT